MKNLRKIKLKMFTAASGYSCCYPQSRTSDRRLHRKGMGIIHVGSLHRLCPNLEYFDGIKIGQISHSLEFKVWEKKLKKLFYDEYVRQGGEREFRAFRSRWITGQPSVPNTFGKKRFM